MYVDPMTVYREYIQNAADAIDEARSSKSIAVKDGGKVTIEIDAAGRSIRIRDNGTGLRWEEFTSRISNLGASAKRGTTARGFRGVGRLAGLGYCQELVFRSRVPSEDRVSELRWDCRRLKAALRSPQHDGQLSELVKEVVSTRRVPAGSNSARFFEVELKGVIRHRDDRLLNPEAVRDYLAQVAPVPFAPEFRLGGDIAAALQSRVGLGQLDIRINDADRPVYRPHLNRMEIGDGEFDKFVDLDVRELPDGEGGIGAVAWVLHHGYSGAIPNKALVKGLRLRTGNMQVGDHALLEDLFPEPRFNAWSVGEIHILDRRVVPNGRRDHFEQSIHLDNLLNHLGPITRDIARRCRQSSISRKWMRDFELHKTTALERAEIAASRGISKAAKKTHVDAAAKSITAMQKIVDLRHLAEETRSVLKAQASATATRISKMLAGEPEATDPLTIFKPQVRNAYEHIIGLIYQCASNRSAAKSLVDKILVKLEATPPKKPRKARRAPKRSRRS
jgi:molecular chaperone HtpG